MQEVKLAIISNGAASTVQALKQYIDQGYTVDAFNTEITAPTAQTKTLIAVVHRERNGQWN